MYVREVSVMPPNKGLQRWGAVPDVTRLWWEQDVLSEHRGHGKDSAVGAPVLWVGIPAPPERGRLRGAPGFLGPWFQQVLPLIQLMCYLGISLEKTLVLPLSFLYCLSIGRKAVYLSPPFNLGHTFCPGTSSSAFTLYTLQFGSDSLK